MMHYSLRQYKTVGQRTTKWRQRKNPIKTKSEIQAVVRSVHAKGNFSTQSETQAVVRFVHAKGNFSTTKGQDKIVSDYAKAAMSER